MSDGLQMKYFVLKPSGTDDYAKASRAAMFRYSLFIREENPTLSKQVWNWATEEFLAAKCWNEEEPPKHWAPPPELGGEE